MVKTVSHVTIVLLTCAIGVKTQIRFVDHFANCRRSDPRFDNCLKDAINSVRPYFKTGLPQYGVRPFDPFHAEEVVQVRGGPTFSYRLVLRNVTEAGWTASEITRLRTNFNKHEMQFTQFFPEKRLNGEYEFEASIFGRRINNSGSWDLLLNDYTQTMKVTRNPRMTQFGNMVYDTPMKVDVNVQFCRHLEMHVSNLLGGRPLLENIADRMINSAWPPGFMLLRPIIGDLVGTAFTKIFNDNLMNFPFDRLVQ